MKSLPPDLMLLNSSTSLSYPSLIIPPSFTVRGTSSLIEFSSIKYNSLNVSIFSSPSVSKILFISGITLILVLSCNKSLAFKLEHTTLPVSLSKSYISYRYSFN